MNKSINILFLGGAKRVSLAKHIIECGNKMKYAINIYSYELDAFVPIACVATVIIGKRWNDETIYEHLEDVIKQKHINIILPFVDPAVEIAAHLKINNPNVFIPCSDVDICKIMFDKCSAETWFTQNNIPIPPSYTNKDKVCYPIIIKPRKGSASKGIKIITDEKQWENVKDKETYVVQMYLSNKSEYTVDCYIAGNGDVISIVPRLRLEVAGGEVIKSITKRDDTIIRLSKDIIESGKFKGPITIQFIRDENTNETYIMEINPRLGGGVITSIEAGANIPQYILEEYLGNALTPNNNWIENTLMTRYFNEVIFHANNY